MDINVNSFNIDSFNYNVSRPSYPKDIFSFLSQKVNKRETAWDCACGTGQVAISLVNCFSVVYATDINENQIRNRIDHERINYSVQKSEHTKYKDNFFDLICVAQALHWFDTDKFFREVNRVLKPDGVFACWGYGFFKINSEIDKIIDDVFLKPIFPYWSDRNHILWNKYRDIIFPFIEIESPAFEMSVNWTKEKLFDYLTTWSAYKRFVNENNQDLKETYFNHLKKVWPDDVKKKISMEFVFYSGRKR